MATILETTETIVNFLQTSKTSYQQVSTHFLVLNDSNSLLHLVHNLVLIFIALNLSALDQN